MSSKNSDPSNAGNKYSNSIIKRPRYRIWRMLVGILAGLFLFILAGGGLFAWIKYEGAVQDLPTVEGLKNYAPPVMSRIYANNDRVMIVTLLGYQKSIPERHQFDNRYGI